MVYASSNPYNREAKSLLDTSLANTKQEQNTLDLQQLRFEVDVEIKIDPEKLLERTPSKEILGKQ